MSTYDAREPETPLETRDQRPPGFHKVNIGHLVMGVAFLGLAFVWLMVEGDVVDPERDGWALGLPWLGAGALGLLATVLSKGRRRP